MGFFRLEPNSYKEIENILRITNYSVDHDYDKDVGYKNDVVEEIDYEPQPDLESLIKKRSIYSKKHISGEKYGIDRRGYSLAIGNLAIFGTQETDPELLKVEIYTDTTNARVHNTAERFYPLNFEDMTDSYGSLKIFAAKAIFSIINGQQDEHEQYGREYLAAQQALANPSRTKLK